MKVNVRLSVICGSILLGVAAVVSVSLLTWFSGAGHNTPLALFSGFGSLLGSVYGYTSIAIVVFFLAAAFLFFLPDWTIRRGVYLVSSIFPFFTLVAAEYVTRIFLGGTNIPFLGYKIAAVFLVAALLIAIEYVLASYIAEYIQIPQANNAPETGGSVVFSDDGIMREEEAVIGEDLQEFAAAQDAPLEGTVFAPENDEAEISEIMAETEGNSVAEYSDGNASREVSLSGQTVETAPAEEIPYGILEEALPDITLVEENFGLDSLHDLQEEFSVGGQAGETAEKVASPDGVTTEEYAYLAESGLTPEEREALDADAIDGQPAVLAEDSFAEISPECVSDIPDFAVDFTAETAVSPDTLCASAAEEVKKDDVLFLDLNWQQHNSVPVRTCGEEASETESAEREFAEIDAADDGELLSVMEAGLEDPFAAIDDIHTIEELEELRDLEQLEENGEFADMDAEDSAGGISGPVTLDVPAVPVFSSEPGSVGSVQSGLPIKPNQYRIPSGELLNTYPDGEYWIVDSETQRAAAILKETLSEFKIEAEVTGIRKGPVITMFEILPAPGVKLTKIVALQDNIALRLAASSVRIVAPIPGKHAVGIEVPNKDRFIVSFRELIDTDTSVFKKMEIPVVLGKDITGEAKLLDLAATPHLLIAGSTGSGKSVCVNSLILSILYKRSPQEVKMILIDPKIVELKLYNDIPHLLTPVITEPKKAFQALQYCLCEMERRYAMLDRMGVRDIRSYNRRITERNLLNEKLPYIVVIIDEFADLMATTGKELESTVARLAAMSRAVGIHLVLATQRPSIDVITGLIKANIPTRIAFMVASKMDSRIIIDQVGAEKLLGKGDMLYSPATDPFPLRIQGTYVSEEEVERVVAYVKQFGEPEYIDEEIFVDDDEEAADPSLFGDGEDPLYDKALEIVLQAGKASASYIQRRLKIGYNRAARLVEEMEQRGIVGPANGSKPREVVHVPR